MEVEEFKGDPPERTLRLDDIQFSSDKESYFIQSSNMYAFNMGENVHKRQDSNKASGLTEYFQVAEAREKAQHTGSEKAPRTKVSEKSIPKGLVNIDPAGSQKLSGTNSNKRSVEGESTGMDALLELERA